MRVVFCLLFVLTSVAKSATLTADPATVVFCGQPGEVISSIPVSVSSDSGAVTYLVANVASDGDWLTVTPAFAMATTTASPELIVAIQGGAIPLPVGTYGGLITLTDINGARVGTIPVSLQVSANGCTQGETGLLFSSSGPLTFQLPSGVKAGTLLNIYNTFPTDLTIIPNTSTANGTDWLDTIGFNVTVVTGLEFPTPFGVGVDATSLAAGQSYTGDVKLRSSNATSLDIPVTVQVTASGAQLVATPSPLQLEIPRGTGTTSVPLQLTNLSNLPISVSLGADQTWLSVSPSSVQMDAGMTATLTASIAEMGLNAGNNTGNITVGGSLSIPVTAKYGIEPQLSATPNPINIASHGGAVTLSVSGTVPFSATATSAYNNPWLAVNSSSGIASASAPASLTVSVQSALLPQGAAVGFITLKPSDGSSSLTIPVNVNAGTDASLSVVPAPLSFAYQQNGAAPASQSLTVSGAMGAGYSVQFIPSSGGNWMSVTPSAITLNGTPAVVSVSVNVGQLAANTYSGQIVLTNSSTGAQKTVPVTLSIGSPVVVAANPSMLAFHAALGAGSAGPQMQTVQLTSTGGTASFTTSSTNFLTVTPSGNTTPATLTIGLNSAVVATLAAGNYLGAVTVSSPGIVGGSQAIPVTLTVSATSPQMTTIVSSASLQPGPLSPGELVTIFGSGFSAAAGVTATLTNGDSLPKMLGSTVLNFDSYAAPLIYVSDSQINAVVPYEIAGQTVTQVTVSQQGIVSVPLNMRVVDTVPAIFSASQSGSGPGAILNSDDRSNGPGNPAAKGSVVQIFATGEGLSRDAVDGALTPTEPPFRTSLAPVSITIGGLPAQITFAGEAPGLVAGILQVDAVVPDGVSSGAQPVVLKIGNNTNTAQSITVAVQ